jgi:hypothetical protein
MIQHTKRFSTAAALTVAGVLSVIMFSNGVFMLINPALWYSVVPGVIRTGAFNQHFIRDIGMLYMLIGGALLVGIFRRECRVILWGTIGLWLSGHAVFHFWEVMAGLCGTDALMESFPGVTLPALVSVGLTIWAWRNPEIK